MDGHRVHPVPVSTPLTKEMEQWNGKDVVYVLALNNGKYYVGNTLHLTDRLAAHEHGGSTWTTLYRPLQVIDVFEGNAFAETVKTKELMEQHGIQNVRGGPWCTEVLEAATVSALEHEFRSAHGACYACGKSGHQIRECTSSRRYILPPRQVDQVDTRAYPSALWTTLDKGFGDSVGDTIMFSGQRDGRLDAYIKEGALYCHRATSADEWTIGGVVARASCILPRTSPAKYELLLTPLAQSGARVRGKAAVLRELGIQVPSQDKWEMSGITCL